jgi:hypothetical protein
VVELVVIALESRHLLLQVIRDRRRDMMQQTRLRHVLVSSSLTQTCMSLRLSALHYARLVHVKFIAKGGDRLQHPAFALTASRRGTAGSKVHDTL